jgi:hypothetical protein
VQVKLRIETESTRWVLWLTPVILATQEAVIRKMVVGSPPRHIVLKTLS